MTPEQHRARCRAWYVANGERHRARRMARYAANRLNEIDAMAAYDRSAAGMLAMVRANAKRRGN